MFDWKGRVSLCLTLNGNIVLPTYSANVFVRDRTTGESILVFIDNSRLWSRALINNLFYIELFHGHMTMLVADNSGNEFEAQYRGPVS